MFHTGLYDSVICADSQGILFVPILFYFRCKQNQFEALVSYKICNFVGVIGRLQQLEPNPVDIGQSSYTEHTVHL